MATCRLIPIDAHHLRPQADTALYSRSSFVATGQKQPFARTRARHEEVPKRNPVVAAPKVVRQQLPQPGIGLLAR